MLANRQVLAHALHRATHWTQLSTAGGLVAPWWTLPTDFHCRCLGVLTEFSTHPTISGQLYSMPLFQHHQLWSTLTVWVPWLSLGGSWDAKIISHACSVPYGSNNPRSHSVWQSLNHDWMRERESHWESQSNSKLLSQTHSKTQKSIGRNSLVAQYCVVLLPKVAYYNATLVHELVIRQSSATPQIVCY